MTDEPKEGEPGRAPRRDDPLERLRQFERERGLEESPVTGEPPETESEPEPEPPHEEEEDDEAEPPP
jgi:hypothetical protein